MDQKQEITNQPETTNHEIQLNSLIPTPYRRMPLAYAKSLRQQINDLEHRLWLVQQYCQSQGLTFVSDD